MDILETKCDKRPLNQITQHARDHGKIPTTNTGAELGLLQSCHVWSCPTCFSIHVSKTEQNYALTLSTWWWIQPITAWHAKSWDELIYVALSQLFQNWCHMSLLNTKNFGYFLLCINAYGDKNALLSF